MTDGAAMMLDSQEVIAKRLWLIGTAGSVPRHSVRKEMQRMGSEKISGAAEATGAMALSSMLAGAKIGAAMWQLVPGSSMARQAKAVRKISTAGAHVLDSGLKPLARRTRSNAKRLRRSRVR